MYRRLYHYRISWHDSCIVLVSSQRHSYHALPYILSHPSDISLQFNDKLYMHVVMTVPRVYCDTHAALLHWLPPLHVAYPFLYMLEIITELLFNTSISLSEHLYRHVSMRETRSASHNTFVKSSHLSVRIRLGRLSTTRQCSPSRIRRLR